MKICGIKKHHENTVIWKCIETSNQIFVVKYSVSLMLCEIKIYRIVSDEYVFLAVGIHHRMDVRFRAHVGVR